MRLYHSRLRVEVISGRRLPRSPMSTYPQRLMIRANVSMAAWEKVCLQYIRPIAKKTRSSIYGLEMTFCGHLWKHHHFRWFLGPCSVDLGRRFH